MTTDAMDESTAAALPPTPDVRRPSRILGALLVSVSLVVAIATYLVLTGLTPVEPTGQVVTWTLIGNGVLVLCLIASVGREAFGLYRARQRGRAAARFHIRIVALFSLIASVPAVLVAIFAFITLDRGLDRWFQDRTREIVENSITVANAYLQEHAGVLRGDLIAMSADVNRARSVYDFDPRRFDTFFSTQARLRQMPAAYLIDVEGSVITRTGTNLRSTPFNLPDYALEEAASGDPVLIPPGATNHIGAVLKLENYSDTYLYVTRAVDPRVVGYLALAQSSANEYNDMSASRAGVQVAFGLVYTGVALVLLSSAVWVGIGFANRVVSPVRRLIYAADEVARGNLNVSVPTRRSEGDLRNLGATFNTMIREIGNQRDELVDTNNQLDERRRFTEAVLSGVTSGVLGIDAIGTVTLANSSALELLEMPETDVIGQSLEQVRAELATVVVSALQSRRAVHQEQLVLGLESGPRTFVVRVTVERSEGERQNGGSDGFVLTLDDITDLVAAQRNAAWADVARRIAHEIKNPLTPIQLSAERLQRRFGRKVEDPSGVFDQCVSTIVRQVGDIGRMVDEFSAFARMPKPSFVDADIRETIREAVFLQTVGHPEITFEVMTGDIPVIVSHDHRLLTQALINIVKNATEAIEDVDQIGFCGRIDVDLIADSGSIRIEVMDNGIGFPDEARQQLLEPYMTTREKGTGLGLAIVRKIVEDHGGRIELTDAPADANSRRGALVRLVLPVKQAAADAPKADDAHEQALDGAEQPPFIDNKNTPEAGADE